MSELNLDPQTTAIVVIDLQKGIVQMPGSPHPAHVVIANCVRLLDAARAVGAQAVLMHVGRAADGKDALQLPVDETWRPSASPQPSLAWKAQRATPTSMGTRSYSPRMR